MLGGGWVKAKGKRVRDLKPFPVLRSPFPFTSSIINFTTAVFIALIPQPFSQFRRRGANFKVSLPRLGEGFRVKAH
jgi:hypothetical protein